MILIDIPIWAAHGTVFAHLVSDTSFDELHDFAVRAGVPPGAFDGDHYDVPQQRYAVCVAAGASVVTGVELVRRMNASGLRLRKRKGEKGIIRWIDASVGGGLSAHIDLVASDRPTQDAGTGAAATIVRDRNQSFLVVRSIRRGSWDCPGGRREPGESVLDCARRELAEETGLALADAAFQPCGYERLTVADPAHWASTRPLVQVFRADVALARPPVLPGDDVDEARWVSHDEFRTLCRGMFWWPLAAYVFDLAR
ncbi:MAG: DUF4031 domain-containing protein [Candidatus Phosphoribacter sp.]|nr:DUF4031 domain-containing protein [Actinomycetales bacterium]